MFTYLNVYVFISGDRTTFGLTILSDGINLPNAALIGGWQSYDVIPMSLNSLTSYADRPGDVHADIIMHGYHVTRPSGNVVPFPQCRRQQADCSAAQPCPSLVQRPFSEDQQ